MHRAVLKIAVFYFFTLTLAAGNAQAAGFYIQEQSVSGLGSAHAGAVADTEDASTIYYNPAGMTDLEKAQFSLGTHMIIPLAEFRDAGSTVSSTVGTGGAAVAINGDDGGNPFDPAAVPNAYLAFPATRDKRIWLGIGISAPFGLSNEYEDDFFGRYDSTENQLITVNVAPSIAMKIRDWLSAGMGIDVQYADAKLENAVPSPFTPGGPVPATDGLQDLSGDDLSIGFNAGVIIRPRPGTRLGLHYRSGISHTMEGRVLTRLPSDVPGIGGTSTRSGASAELDLPNIASAGFSQKLSPRLKLLGHVTWFEWSNFDDIPVQLDSGAFSSTLQNYRNTWAGALGLHFRATRNLTLKAGVQYDQTPTQDGFRTTRIPDGDRRWLTLGASYDVNDRITLDIAGAYIDVEEEPVNLTRTTQIGASSVTANIQGKTEGSVGILSAGFRYKFDLPKRRNARRLNR